LSLVVGRFLIPATAGVESQLLLNRTRPPIEDPNTTITPQGSWGVVVKGMYSISYSYIVQKEWHRPLFLRFFDFAVLTY